MSVQQSCPLRRHDHPVERKKPGPKGKGPRKELRPRIPPALYEAVCREAASAGVTLNDYVGELLAERTGVPYSPQEALKTA